LCHIFFRQRFLVQLDRKRVERFVEPEGFREMAWSSSGRTKFGFGLVPYIFPSTLFGPTGQKKGCERPK
jgi:hypothetical protein